jgi:hypothetical protein
VGVRTGCPILSQDLFQSKFVVAWSSPCNQFTSKKQVLLLLLLWLLWLLLLLLAPTLSPSGAFALGMLTMYSAFT